METEYFVDWHLFVEGVDKGVECTGLAGQVCLSGEVCRNENVENVGIADAFVVRAVEDMGDFGGHCMEMEQNFRYFEFDFD